MKNLSLFILIILSTSLSAQSLKNLYPAVSILELNKKGEKDFTEHQKKCEELWNKYNTEEEYNTMPQAEKDFLLTCSEVEQSYWEVIDGGCSWYCGGGPKEVTASSFLASQGKNSYEAENAHDLNYKSVWVEGVKGYGIGEYLLYDFAAYSPQITEIKIANGYVKSQVAWQNNSRVKKLKMYVNGNPYAILHLEDKRAVQSFSVEPIGTNKKQYPNNDAPDWSIKFEIMEVYPGTKYDDVVLSEIFFDGIGVHCLAKGTMITMADRSEKEIERLSIGDDILSFNSSTNSYESDKIIELANPIHHDLIEIILENGTSLTATQDHPLLTESGIWASSDPKKTMNDYEFNRVDKLASGTILKTNYGLVKISQINHLNGSQETFTIVKLAKNQTFIANGILTGTEVLRKKFVCKHHKVSPSTK